MYAFIVMNVVNVFPPSFPFNRRPVWDVIRTMVDAGARVHCVDAHFVPVDRCQQFKVGSYFNKPIVAQLRTVVRDEITYLAPLPLRVDNFILECNQIFLMVEIIFVRYAAKMRIFSKETTHGFNVVAPLWIEFMATQNDQQ